MKRRQALGSLIGAAAAPAIIGGAAAAATLDPANPADMRTIFRKLAHAADEKVHFWWMRGTRLGLVDSAFTPFWEMHVGTIYTVRDLDADSYEVTSLGINWYTDLATGKFLETFRNPYTGKEHKVPYAPAKPGKRVYDKAGLKMAFERPGMTLKRKGDIGPAWIEGKDVWVRGDTSVRGEPSEPGGKIFQVNDMSTYFGAVKDVTDPKVTSAPAGQAFSDVNTWPDWLEMGSIAGNYFSRCFGRKTESYAGMPKIWREITEMKYPAIAKDPAGALKG
jgi:hypothetical protein